MLGVAKKVARRRVRQHELLLLRTRNAEGIAGANEGDLVVLGVVVADTARLLLRIGRNVALRQRIELDLFDVLVPLRGCRAGL